MLTIPSKGFARSVTTHNVDLNICCDWLEASVLFTSNGVSKSDVVDVLRENEIYSTQEFASTLVDDVFGYMRDRRRISGPNYPFDVAASRLSQLTLWQDFAPYSFCLTASLAPLYPDWARSFGANHQQQGELFEVLTAEAMRAQYSGWEVLKTGWTRTSKSRIVTVAAEVANALGETIGDIGDWTTDDTKEAGLDLLCFRPYNDDRPGLPAFLVQCASGEDWKKKLKTPDLRVWTKIVSFPNDPKKALSMPFAICNSEFRRRSNVLNGLLLDRLRLLSHHHDKPLWLTADTETLLIEWVSNRVGTLPQLEAA